MRNIRTITLDLDDTLWEIHPVIHRAERRLYEWLGEHYPRITEKFEPTDMREVRSQVIAEFSERSHDLTFLRRTVLTRVGAAAGYSDHFVDDAFAVFDEVRNAVDIFPEVIPALEKLHERYVVIALTNGNANLDMIGIGHFFEGVIASADVGVSKPAKRIFDVAVAAAGCEPTEILHVGDHPETDIDGARAAGLRTAWMNRVDAEWPEHLPAPDTIVTTISELAQVLEPARRAARF